MGKTIVELKKCNNIDYARVTITENELNIKYAYNFSNMPHRAKVALCIE